MKAVRDALELLLAVARRRDGSATPSAPAEELGLNVSTARRLLQDLADTGFIEQASRRGGYRPGPSAAYLFAGSRYRPELHAAFAAPLAAFAGKFGTDASLSVRLGPGRTVLLAFDGTGRETTAEYPPRIDDLYSSAAGRLLFALAPETHRVHLVWERGIPGGTVWPEIGGDRSRIAEALAPIRRARFLRYGGNCAAAVDEETVLLCGTDSAEAEAALRELSRLPGA